MNHKMTRAAVSLLLFAMLPMGLPTATADHKECRDENWGWGSEPTSCSFVCDAGDTVFVSVDQDDDSDVSGDADCNTAHATCVGVGLCNSRGSTIASEGDHGGCEGQAYSGAWTDAHLWCGAGDGNV